MKTIEYPIKEMVRFEMDKNKLWWLRYNREHECFPQVRKKWGDKERHNKKGYREFVRQTNMFCAKNNFSLEGNGFGMIDKFGRNLVSWGDKEVLQYNIPSLLFPKTQTGCVFGRVWEYDEPLPYYGNPHYKKYIEDNNGECPLPLPKDVKWWEV